MIGGPEKVRKGLRQIQDVIRADELMIYSEMFDVHNRLRSPEILAEAAR